jgi:hypothetical protein
VRGTEAQGKPKPDRAALTEQLIRKTQEYYQANSKLVETEPEISFEIVRDNWSTVAPANIKPFLMFLFVRANNPHVLDVIHLAAMDGNPTIHTQAFNLVLNYAFDDFAHDQLAYLEWRKGIEGKSLDDVVRAGCRHFVDRLARADEAERNRLLNLLLRMDFSDSSPLSKLRRKVALEAGILEVLARLLTPPDPPNAGAIYALRSLKPDDDYLRRVIVPLTTRSSQSYTRYAAASILGTVQKRWTADLLLKMLLDEYPSQESWALINTLSVFDDPHLIPGLIAVYEAEAETEDTSQVKPLLDFALNRMTHVQATQLHDGIWWHLWWDRNRARFPEDVRALPFPKVKKRVFPGVSVPRKRVEWVRIGDDPQRSYLLLSPGTLTSSVTGEKVAGNRSTCGLIVVLAGGDGNGEDLAEFWMEAISKALKERYFVALPIAPKWRADQAAPWITGFNAIGGVAPGAHAGGSLDHRLQPRAGAGSPVYDREVSERPDRRRGVESGDRPEPPLSAWGRGGRPGRLYALSGGDHALQRLLSAGLSVQDVSVAAVDTREKPALLPAAQQGGHRDALLGSGGGGSAAEETGGRGKACDLQRRARL